ncbi:MAG: hypothetical protein R3F11_21975 [Verrucomicrobiales bacterium]
MPPAVHATDDQGNSLPRAQATLELNIYDQQAAGTKLWGLLSPNADLIGGRFSAVLGPNDTAARPIRPALP